MSNKRFIRDPTIKGITDLVSDEELEAAFRNTNFGHNDFRGLLAQGCIKTLAGWHDIVLVAFVGFCAWVVLCAVRNGFAVG